MYIVTSLIHDYEHDTELRGVFDNLDDVREFIINNCIEVDEYGNFSKVADKHFYKNGNAEHTYELFTIHDIELNKHYKSPTDIKYIWKL